MSDWKETCAKCMDGDIEPRHCEYYGEPNGCNSPSYGQHPTTEKSSAVGNASAMREAVETALTTIRGVIAGTIARTNNSVFDCRDKLKAALSAPARNCDVGTAEEHAQRFYNFCESNSSGINGMCKQTCPCIDCFDKCQCLAKWSLMPYEAEDGESYGVQSAS